MKSEVFILSNKFDRSISTRVAVENLFKSLTADELVIDFTNICFISASAAHQMVIEIKLLDKKNVNVTCENMNYNISKMLELAKTDRKNIFTVTPQMKHTVIRSESDLSKLLLGAI